ncbi:MAG: hypothetical protein NZ701_14000, partial [Roseiflexus sp.]|nr:hypothetical protein [Roseiflexus sp.]
SARQGVLTWLGAHPDVPVHESNARDVASYLIEFTQENLSALPRITTSARLGLIGEGLGAPAGSVGYAEPVQYAGRLPIRVGSDADACPRALRAVSGWSDAWAAPGRQATGGATRNTQANGIIAHGEAAR